MGRFSVLDADRRVINHVESESDFASTQGWIPAGNSKFGDEWDGEKYISPPAPPQPVPQSVTARQAKRALLEAGLLDDVEDAIAAIPDDLERRRVQIDWVESQDFRRDWPALLMLAQELKLDEGTLNALFIEAATL